MSASLRFLATFALAAFALTGCSEPRCAQGATKVGGICQRSSEDDGGAPDAGDESTLMCSDGTCAPTITNLVPLSACCDEAAAGACGATVPPISGNPLSGCHAKALPGPASQGCGEFLDQLDPPLTDGFDPGDDGAYTFTISGDVVSLPGCCTPTGLCGVVANDLLLQGQNLQLGLGCVPISSLEIPAELEPPTIPPFCVPAAPDSSACAPELTIAIAGQEINLCEQLVESGLPLIGCDPTAQTPRWVCAAQNLPTIDSADGQPPSELGECLEYVPEFVTGCGVGVQGTFCISNVESSRFGCVDVDALPTTVQDAILATVTEIVCGCGDGVTGAGNCIPNVGVTLCGSKPADVDTRGTADTADDCLLYLPEFVRGCGEDGVPDAQNFCARHAPAIFGCVEFAGDAVPGYPEFLCGCGDGVATSGCIANIPTTVCGAVDIPSGPIPGVPNASCGCGDGVGGKDCLRNVSETVCGAVPRCTEGEAGSQAGDATHCADGEVCADLHGSGGTTGEPPGDDIGDSCISSG